MTSLTQLTIQTRTRIEFDNNVNVRTHLWRNLTTTTTCVKMRRGSRSVTRLGDFWKFVATKFLTKEALNEWQLFWAILENLILCNNSIGYFLGNLGEILGNFYSYMVTLALWMSVSLLQGQAKKFSEEILFVGVPPLNERTPQGPSLKIAENWNIFAQWISPKKISVYFGRFWDTILGHIFILNKSGFRGKFGPSLCRNRTYRHHLEQPIV